MNNIAEFVSRIAKADGFARQNRYQVFIPTSTLGIGSNKIFKANQDSLQFPEDAVDWMNDFFESDLREQGLALSAFCEKAELPGYQFQVETQRHYGPSFKIPHMPEYQDITLTFMCGSNMLERYFFDAWMYMVMDPITNNFNYIDEYSTDIDIVQFKEKADIDLLTGAGPFASTLPFLSVKPNYVTTLIDAFPIAVNTQELGYDLNDSVQKVQVTFTYKSAIPFTGKESTKSETRRGQTELLTAFQSPDKADKYKTTINP